MPARGPGTAVPLPAGPLARGSDRVELASLLLCALLVLLALPVAMVVGTVVGGDTSQQAREQASSRIQVEAVLLAAAPATAVSETGTLAVATPATWRAPDGSIREGSVLARLGARAGDRVRIWVDPAGQRTQQPLITSDVVTIALVSGLCTFLGLAVAAFGGHLAVVRGLERHRARQWEREWRSVEPHWTGRR